MPGAGRLDRAELEALAPEYDRAVEADGAIDAFCSSSAWVLSFAEAFHPEAPVHAAREGDDFAALLETRDPRLGRVLQPLEAMWGFASPVVGPGAAGVLDALLARERAHAEPAWLLLTGLPVARARLEPLVRVFTERYALRALPPTQRFQASLEGGFDGWLARRSTRFRRNLRAALRRTRAAGVAFTLETPRDSAAAAAAHARSVAIERRAWKSAAGGGVDRGEMRAFYARMLPRLAARGALRVLFATRDGVDLGYVYGGVSRGLFRGLQFSFAEEARPLGLGNALQAEMIARLCEEGVAVYDLGAQSEYKRRWAEAGLVTAAFAARPLS
jgi:CelD/BcsL family acetyltransferase involved in cellulose biosynthesis